MTELSTPVDTVPSGRELDFAIAQACGWKWWTAHYPTGKCVGFFQRPDWAPDDSRLGTVLAV